MTLPDTLERARQELDLQITLGPVLMAVKGFASPDTERAYARARELCQQVGETPQLFPALHGLWRFYMVRTEFQAMRDLAEQLFSLAQRVEDPALLLEAHRVMGQTMFWLGENVPAREHLEQGMALYDPQQHRSHAFVYGQDPGVACRSSAAWPIWMLGYPDQALQSSHEALLLAQECNHPFSLAFALIHAVLLHQFRREAKVLQDRAEELIALSTEQGFPVWLAYGTILRGWALNVQRAGAEGITQIRQGLADYQITEAKIHQPYFIGLMAEAYGIVGQPEEGLKAVVEGLAIVENTGERHCEAELHRQKGELLLALSDENHAEAEACFLKAVKIARRQSAKSIELRTIISLSRLWQQEKREEAHQRLSEIYGWFTEGFDTADLKEAKVLLEELA